MKGKLYLIPNTLGENTLYPFQNGYKAVLDNLKYLLVENGKEARKFLKSTNISKRLNEFEYLQLDKNSDHQTQINYLKLLEEGNDLGIISDAGCPGVADPGAEFIKMAHDAHVIVVPLIGPSSILLGLMASGFNGQRFVFHGYLPRDRAERSRKIKEIEIQSEKLDQTQIFIETPYRNDQVIEEVLKTCKENTRFCVAANLTLSNESILSMPVLKWKKRNKSYHKYPAIFLLYHS